MGELDWGLFGDVAALSAAALAAYWAGRRTRRAPKGLPQAPLADELVRAGAVADRLSQIGRRVAGETAAHARCVAAFQAQAAAMQTGAEDVDWARLRDQADKLLEPTLKLATTLTVACDQLRRQQAQLITFSGSRIDAATGLHNRRSLQEQLDAQLSIHATGKRRFSLALFSVCPTDLDAPEVGEQRLRQVARLLEACIRDDDFVARYSHDEFVVLMPQTPLSGALAFGARLLVRAHNDLACPMWGGAVEAVSGETPEKLLSRADSALYSARAAGDPALFQHTGAAVRRHAIDLEPADEMSVEALAAS